MKKTAVILFLLLLCSLLFSCHGADTKEAYEVPDTFDTSREYEISFWAKNDTNMNQVAIYEKAIEDFEALYPNIKVNLKLYTDYGRIYSDVITNFSTDTTPNVCITYPDHIATYLTNENSVVSLNSLFENEKYGLGGSEVRFDSPEFDELVPKFIKECEFGGNYYAVPFMRSTEVCYVNKTYVEKLGYTLPETLTWDFIWEVSDAAMAKDEDGNFIVNGQKRLTPFIYKSTDNMMIQALYQQGADYSTVYGEIGIFNPTTEAFLKEISKHSELRSFNTFKKVSYPANHLNKGQCIFAIDSTAGATWMGSEAPLVDIKESEIVDFETEVMTIPQFDLSNPLMISQGPSVCVFNKDDPQVVLASWLFCQFLLTNSVQIPYSQTEGYVPVTIKAQESPEYVDYLSREGEDDEFYYEIKLRAVKLLIENTDNTFVTPVFNGSADLRNAAGELIEQVNTDTRAGKSIDDEYISALYEKVAGLYHLNEIELSRGELTFGSLPAGAKALLWTLGACWIGIIVYVTVTKIKNKKH